MSSFVKTLFLRGSTVLATLILFIWLPENMAFEAFYCLNYFYFLITHSSHVSKVSITSAKHESNFESTTTFQMVGPIFVWQLTNLRTTRFFFFNRPWWRKKNRPLPLTVFKYLVCFGLASYCFPANPMTSRATLDPSICIVVLRC